MRWLNRVLAAHVLRLRRANFYDSLKDFRGFFIAEDEIDALLAAGIFEMDVRNDDDRGRQMAQLLAQAQKIRQDINRQTCAAAAQNLHLPLAHLARCFSLRALEQHMLIICLAPQIDGRYEKLYAYLQNDLTKRFASVDLILDLLLSSSEERLQMMACFHPSAPLRHWGLVETGEKEPNPAASRNLIVDTRIVHLMLGNNAVDPRVQTYLRFYPPLAWNEVVVAGTLQSRLRQFLQARLHDANGQRPILYFHGRPGVGKKTIARALCSETGIALAVADMRPLLRSPEIFAEQVRLILREGLLRPCAIYFDHFEKLESLEGEAVARLM